MAPALVLVRARHDNIPEPHFNKLNGPKEWKIMELDYQVCDLVSGTDD